jgi:WD40 repeat protein
VNDAAFSPDGRWIVTAARTAGLWDARKATLVKFLKGHEGELTSAAFAPDSRRIVTAGIDGTIRVYRCEICGTLEELLPLARRRLAAAGYIRGSSRQRVGG